MSDLSYNDVQRAVQDGVRNVQSDVQRLVNDMSNVSQQAQLIDDISRDVQELHRFMMQLQPKIDTIERSVTDANDDQRIMSMQNDIQELKNRFSSIERFAQQMSNYMQARHDEEKEDRLYRNV
ncbi:MAG TPA: hypothetical protein VFZ48_05100 [Candidatus Saccharimonadales bacterium]